PGLVAESKCGRTRGAMLESAPALFARRRPNRFASRIGNDQSPSVYLLEETRECKRNNEQRVTEPRSLDGVPRRIDSRRDRQIARSDPVQSRRLSDHPCRSVPVLVSGRTKSLALPYCLGSEHSGGERVVLMRRRTILVIFALAFCVAAGAAQTRLSRTTLD